MLFILLFLGLDQAGRQLYTSPSNDFETMGRSARRALEAPAGAYNVMVRIHPLEPVRSVRVRVGSLDATSAGIRLGSMFATADIPLGSIEHAGGPVEGMVETSLDRGTVHELVLEPAIIPGVSQDALQRLCAALAIVLGLVALPRRARASAGIVVALVVGLTHARLFLYDLAPLPNGDERIQYFPFYELALREASSGRLALWNPHTFLGLPHLAEVQVQHLWPPVFAMLLGGVSFARRLLAVHVLQMALAGVGAALLARRLGVSRSGAALAGILFALSPARLAGQHGPIQAVVALMPWALWLAATPASGVLLAVVVALSILAGHPQYLSFTLLGVAVTILYPPRPARGLVRDGAVGVALGALLSGALLLPFAEFGEHSTRRRGLTPEHASLGASSFRQLLRLCQTGWPERHVPRMPSFRNPSAIAVGLGGLPLVAAGLAQVVRRRRRRAVVYLLAVIAVSCAFAAGDLGPWSPFTVLSHVPPWAGQRAPSRALCLAQLALCVLAALGLDRLRAAARRRRGLALPALIGFALLVLGAAATTLPLVRDEAAQRGILIHSVLFGAALLLVAGAGPRIAATTLFLLAIADRFDDTWTLRAHALPAAYQVMPSLGRPRQPALREIVLTSPATNDNLATRRLSAWGADPVIPYRTALLWNQVRPTMFEFDASGALSSIGVTLVSADVVSPKSSALLAAMGVSRLLLRPERLRDFDDSRLVVHRSSVRGLELEVRGAARARLVERLGQDDAEGLLQATVAVVRVRDLAAGRVEVDLDAPHPAGVLVLSDAYYPGWVAHVDGAPTPIRPACGALRAVEVPATATTVTFDYTPFSFRLGLFLSLAGAALTAAAAGRRQAWWLSFFRWRRRAHAGPRRSRSRPATSSPR